MAAEKQHAAAKKNVKKDQETRPGTPDSASTGEGQFYRIEVRPKEQFVTFRNRDVCNKRGIERLAGKRPSGLWDTATWLVSKNCAHIENRTLVADKPDVKELFEQLGSPPVHIEGDIFKAKGRRNVHENEKPTEARKRARTATIKKAQSAGNHK